MKAKYDIYIRMRIRSKFDEEVNKSGLINDLLEKHYSLSIENTEAPVLDKPTIKKLPKKVLDIPGVEIASQAICKGTHYMNRINCGKIDCPWKES